MLKKLLGITRADELVSMFLGLAIVLVASWILFNYFRKEVAGNIDLPGLSIELPKLESLTKKLDNNQKDKSDVVTMTQKVVEQKMVLGLDTSGYEVKRGESLWKIAKKELGDGNRYIEIAKLNNLASNMGNLRVGQKLLLPKVEKVSNPNTNNATIIGNEYIVQKGDSLASIALRAYGDTFAWSRIWQANKVNIKNPNLIFSGNRIVIPR